VTCPVALFPATSDSEKISFNQINRSTGHRTKYLKVDADRGEEVSSDEIMKSYKVDNDTYIEITKDELENIALDLGVSALSSAQAKRCGLARFDGLTPVWTSLSHAGSTVSCRRHRPSPPP
jgi:Ku70/Ku80 beta-barrel domain